MSAFADLLLRNRWLVLAIVLFVFLLVQWFVRGRDVPPDDGDDVGDPPPAGGTA